MVAPSSRILDRMQVTFEDTRAVANAGLVLPATLAAHLGAGQIIDQAVDLGDDPGAPNPDRKALTVMLAMLAGGQFIDDVDLLRAGATGRAVGFQPAAPSTVGTFLRAFTFGHVRQLDKAAEGLLGRAWEAGAGPAAGEVMFVDLDSTVQEVFGYAKAGAAYGHTGKLGYHPLVATRAATGEVLHVRHRTGSAHTGRGAERFVRELAGRLGRVGHDGPVVVRADSGFWSSKVLDACTDHELEFSVTVRQTSRIRRLIDAIEDDAWQPLDDYPAPGRAQVAETALDGHRLIIRRVHHPDAADDQDQLFDTWRHHPFVTNRGGDVAVLDAEHRAHAKIELAIRDLKDGGWAHNPSGQFNANAAWLVLGALAHNLARWTGLLGLPQQAALMLKTLRARLLAVPGRLTSHARRIKLSMPANWPWRKAFMAALDRLRAIPQPA